LRTARALALLLLGAGIFSGCGDSVRKLRLVTLTDLTGPNAAYGDGIRKAAGLALEEHRLALEKAGWQVELTAYDARGSVQDFTAAVSRIAAQPDVFCGILHTDTAKIFSAIPLLRTAGIPAVFPAETTPVPEDDPLSGTLWLSPDDSVHGAADAGWAAADGFTEVFMLAESGGHSQIIADGFLQRAETLTLPVTVFPLSPQQYSSAWILSFNNAAPRLVYYSGSAHALPALLADLERLGFQGSFFFAEGEAEDRLPTPVESDSIRFIFSPAAYRSEDILRDDPFAEKYRGAYEADPPPLSELGFDAAALCLQPLLQAGRGDPDPSVPRDAVRSAWRSGRTWEGYGGSYSLDGRRPCRTWIYTSPHGSLSNGIPVLEPYSPVIKSAAC
jgi:ABC-type branched-subunit amino acid transport system substrate-binding protein